MNISKGWRAIVLCALFPVAGAAQVSILEAAIKHPDAQVYSSSQIARLESGDSRAVFTGLVVADPAQADRKIRGVRIEFSDDGWTRSAYVDEGKLQPLKDIVDRLAVDLERLLPRLARSSSAGFLGSCEFRDHPDSCPLQVDYCYSGSCSPALRITSPTLITFNQRTPSDLSAILAAAIEYLRTR